MRSAAPRSGRRALVLGVLAALLLALVAWLARSFLARPSGARGAAEEGGVHERRPAALVSGEPDAAASAAEPRVPHAAGAPPAAAPPAEAAKEARTGELRGRVVDGAGRPLAGARVALQRGIAREFTVLDLEVSRRALDTAEAWSDAQGEFRFELARGLAVDVRASWEGCVDALAPDRYAGDYVELVLTPGYLVHGRITRARDGAPVAGAEVRVFRLGGPSSLERETASAGDGSYELRFTFAEEATLEVVPRIEQASDWLSVHLGEDGTLELDVRVADGIVVEGRITDAATGLPIEGAIVGEGWWYRRRATSDEDGRYRMNGFGDPGASELFARAPGYGEVKRVSLPGAVEGVLHVDFELAPGNAARGRLLDSAGAPLPDAYVAAVASQHRDQGQETDWRSGTTDAEGRFLLEGLTPGLRHALLAHKEGYATCVWDFPHAELEEEEVDLGDLVLGRPALVAGQVLDAEDRPLADVRVTLHGWNADRGRFAPRGAGIGEIGDFYVATRSLVTTQNGRFEFGDVATGVYSLGGRLEGRPPLGPLQLEVAPEELRTGLVLRAVGGLALRGRTVDEDGGPVAGVHLNAQLLDADGPGPISFFDATAKTDAGGAFAFEGLPAGEYSLRAYPFWIEAYDPDAPWLMTTVERVRTGGEDLLLLMEKGERVSGLVLDAGGTPLAGYEVGPAGDLRTSGALVTTDVEGRFALAVPRGALVELEVRGPSEGDGLYFQSEPLLTLPGVAAGTKDLVLRLPE